MIAGDHRPARLGVAIHQRVEGGADGLHGGLGERLQRLGDRHGELDRSNFLARLAIRAARSPIRSRSRLTRMTVSTRRKSDATGS